MLHCTLCIFVLLCFAQQLISFRHNSTTQYVDDRYVEFIDDEMIYNEKLYKVEERYRLNTQLISEAHSKYHFPPGVVYINNDDLTMSDSLKDKNIYYIAYNIHRNDIFRKHSGPGYSAAGWPSAQIPSFDEEVLKIMEASEQKPLYQKIGWIGNIGTSPNRPTMVHYSHAHPNFFDFKHFPAEKFCTNSSEYLSLPDMVREFAYLIDIQGQGYSGRTKYLLYSNRPLFYVERAQVEYFNIELQPYQHYIPVKNDLSDLLSQFYWALDHPAKVAQIALNALNYAKANMTHNVFVDKIAETFQYMLSDKNTDRNRLLRRLQVKALQEDKVESAEEKK